MNQVPIGQKTFTQLHHDIRNLHLDAQKHGSKSLRLHGNDIKVHTTTRRIGHSDNRATKQLNAHDAIRDAIDREIGPGYGDRVLQNVNLRYVRKNETTRVALKDLRPIQTGVDAMKVQIQTAKQALMGPAPARIRPNTNPQQAIHDRQVSELNDAVKFLANNPALAPQLLCRNPNDVGQLRKAYASFAEQLFPIHADLPDLEVPERRQLRNGLDTARNVVGRDLSAEIQRQFVAAMNGPVGGAGPQQGPAVALSPVQRQQANAAFQQMTVPDVATLRGFQWDIAGAGAGGTVLVRNANNPADGFAFKIEHPEKVRVADEVGRLIEGVLDRSNDPAPFEIARHKAYGLTPETALSAPARQALNAELNTLSNQTGNRTGTKAHVHLQRLADVQRPVAISQYSLIDGSSIASWSTAERFALMKSDFFPKDVGKMSVLAPVLGLCDHATPFDTPAIKNNLSNFMLTSTNRLVVIDYDTPVTQGNNQLGIADNDLTQCMDAIFQLFQPAGGNPPTIADIVNRIITTEQAAFHGLVAKMTTAEDDGLFDRFETVIDATVQNRDKQAVAAKLLLGALDGLQYVKDNQQAIVQSHTDRQPNFLQTPGQTLQNVVTGYDNIAARRADIQNFLAAL